MKRRFKFLSATLLAIAILCLLLQLITGRPSLSHGLNIWPCTPPRSTSFIAPVTMPTCLKCGISFGTSRQLAPHQKSCQGDAARLRATEIAVQKGRQEFEATASRKRQELSNVTSRVVEPPVVGSSSTDTSAGRPDSNAPTIPPTQPEMYDTAALPEEETIMDVDAHVENAIDALRSTPPLHTASGRPLRACVTAARRRGVPYQDVQPEGPSDEPAPTLSVPEQVIRRVRLLVRKTFAMLPNVFGIYRVYFDNPPSPPPPSPPPYDLAVDNMAAANVPDVSLASLPADFSPFPNRSSWSISNWFWNQGASKTVSDFMRLMNVFRDSDFRLEDVLVVPSWESLFKKLGSSTEDDEASWQRADLNIEVPFSHSSGAKVKSAVFTVPQFQYRRLLSVIKDVISLSPAAKTFQWTSFIQYWCNPSNPNDPPQRIYDELYSSDAFIRAEAEVGKLPPEGDCALPRVVAALMFWSDSTHLTQFGTWKMWPIYMAFGNQSKYIRCRPAQCALHHVAYIPSFPDSFKDWYVNTTGDAKGPRQPLMAHCHRELMHAVWHHLLDDDFLHAYKHGVVVDCADGVKRRVFPRIFTYSADYPEKVLLASIRNLGTCPCPRCLIKLADIPQLDLHMLKPAKQTDSKQYRTKIDKARQRIYGKSRSPVNGKHVETLLFAESLVPTKNAFSSRLSILGVDFFRIFVSDVMHEFELGVWKSLFTHLIWMLDAQDSADVNLLDKRYRTTPQFSFDTVRKFRNNTSEMKKLAAHDLEQILMCAIPVFEGLFNDQAVNDTILDLLFATAYLHGLTKLRMHHDGTLKLLREATQDFFALMREFKENVCPRFKTTESTREASARVQRAASDGRVVASGRTPKSFNLATYKIHAIRHYPEDIPNVGTTDGYSTQPGEHEHSRLKSGRFPRTSMTNLESQMAAIDQRERRILQIGERCSEVAQDKQEEAHLTSLDDRPHHHITSRQRTYFNMYYWVNENRNKGPAIEGFISKLLDHVLARLRGRYYEGNELNFTDYDRRQVIIQYDRIYTHPRARFNYTTYDLRRDQDIINLATKRDIMLLSNDDPSSDAPPHPFWYARVLGIFHAMVRDTASSKPLEQMEFLWVRWFACDSSGYRPGWSARRLDWVGFDDGDGAFGFLDPSQVVRACHLIPAFHFNREDILPPGSLGTEEGGDWAWLYVNRFADHDMLMRYIGLGIGHSVVPTLAGFGAEGVLSDAAVRSQIQSDDDITDAPYIFDDAAMEEDSNNEDAESAISIEDEDALAREATSTDTPLDDVGDVSEDNDLDEVEYEEEDTYHDYLY